MALTKVSTGMLSADAASVDLNIDAGTMFIDASANRVGIGNTSPATALDVTGTVTSDGLTVTGTLGNWSIDSQGAIQSFTRASANYIKASSAGGYLVFQTGGTNERLRVNDSGIDVTGSVAADGLSIDSGSTNTQLTLARSTTHSGISFSTQISDFGGGGADLIFDGSGNSAGFGFRPTNSSGTLQTGLIISPDGNVGIGTSSPATLLELSALNGTSGENNTLRFTETDNAVEANQVIGKIEFKSNDSSGDGALVRAFIKCFSEDTTPSTAISFATHPGGTGNTTDERMRIDSNGNVLVGTTDTTIFNDNADEYGFMVEPSGQMQLSANNATMLYLNRQNGDGTIVDFRKDGTAVGSIGSISSDLYIAESNSGLRFDGENNQILPSSTTASTDGTCNLGAGSARFKDLHLSQYVIAHQGAFLGGNGSANHLDDYEEGTWIPALVGSTTAGSHTYGYQNGKYTKIGNTVTASFGMYISTKDGSMAGNVNVSGLPVSASMGTNVFASLTIGWAANITYGDMLGGYMNSGTSISLRLNNSAAAAGFLNSSAVGSGSVYLFGTITYQTA